MKLYADHDPRTLEPWYCRHVNAMTAEGLHSKSEIAIQLAARDCAIDELVQRLGAMVGEKQPMGVNRPVYQQALGTLMKFQDRERA